MAEFEVCCSHCGEKLEANFKFDHVGIYATGLRLKVDPCERCCLEFRQKGVEEVD